MIKAVIFDLDGTLVEFNLDYKRLRAEVLNILQKRHLPISVFSAKERITSIIEKAERLMTNKNINKKEINDVKKEIFLTVNQYELEAARTTYIIPSVIPTLKTLKKLHLKMGVFTISGKRPTEYILKRFKLKGFFDAVVTREDALKVKPNPEHLKIIFEMLNVKPRETIVVGDSESDMICARETGAIAVGIKNKRTSIDRLVSAGADYVISAFTDLITLIQNINRH